MPQGGGLLLPQLGAVPIVHRLVADDSLAVALAKSLVEADIAAPEDWSRAEADPTSFIRLTLERWIDSHGGAAIRRRLVLAATLSSSPCEWAEEDEANPRRLFLAVEPSEAGCVVFDPTMELLEKCHPSLPVTFFNLFAGALNRWIRVYDHRDAEDRAETLREWIAQEPDAEQYELPDIEGSIPACMKEPALDKSTLGHVKKKISDPLVMNLFEAVLALERVSAEADRPELGDDIGQMLSDCNPPLPSLVAIFREGDGVSAAFSEESEGMLAVTPEPNLIIPFDPTSPESAREAFRTFGVACETLAAASRLIDLMPGNDSWVITG